MRSTWAPVALGFALACASASSQTSASEHPAPRATAAAPAAAATVLAAPRPMTAAEAAEKAHEEWARSHGSGAGAARQDASSGQPQEGSADDAPCATDADCTLTRIAPGSCCASLCSPRAVTRTRAREVEQRGADCRGCVEPLCREPGRVGAGCRAGRCVAIPMASPD